jgi:outer membrane protein assembly factor BamB
VAAVAQGRAFGRFEAALGVVGVLALAITYSLITGWNPVTNLDGWLAHPTALSDPPSAWAVRLDGQPTTAAVVERAVVVTRRDFVEAYDLGSGRQLWSVAADWGGVAGSGAGSVVLVGKRGHGYDVVDPTVGSVRWSDTNALAAWTYRETILSLTCPGLAGTDCTLSSRAPADGTVRWKTPLQGFGHSVAGLNTRLLGSRELAGSYADALAGSPGSLPQAIGLPIDQRVQVVDTATGVRLSEESVSENTRVVVVAGRVLRSTAVGRDGDCRYTLSARDPASGQTIWTREGYDLGTASGVSCQQRRDPGGSDTVLVATRGDNRRVFLAARDGHELWVAPPGEEILATDGRYGAVRSADRTQVSGVDLNTGTVVWTQQASIHSEVAITPAAVLISEGVAGRVLALDPASGRPLLNVTSQASILGVGENGLVLNRGSTIGFLGYSTISP